MTRLLAVLITLLLPAWCQAQCDSPRISSLCANLADTMIATLQVHLDRGAPLQPAAFANLNESERTSPLGRILAEELGSEFARRGYLLTESRPLLAQGSAGSSVPDQGHESTQAQAVLTGTYAVSDAGVQIAARLIRTRDRLVLAAASCSLRLTETVRLLLGTEPPPIHSSPQPTTTLNLSTKADAMAVQQALAARDLYKGKIDGKWGARSQEALQRFQTTHNLPSGTGWNHATQDILLRAQ